MRVPVAIFAVLIATLAHAGVDKRLSKLIGRSASSIVPTAGTVPVEVPFYAPFIGPTGRLIEDEATTASNVYWTAGGLADTQSGVTWSRVGTVPITSSSPFYPSRFTGSPRVGAGPFDGTNVYTASSSSLNFSAPFTICNLVLQDPIQPVAQQYLGVTGVFLVEGYFDYVYAANFNAHWNSAGATVFLQSAPLVNAPALICYQAETSIPSSVNVYQNGNFASSSTLNVYVPGTADSTIGAADATGTAPWLGVLYERWYTGARVPASGPAHTELGQRMFGARAETGQYPTFARTSAATLVPVDSASPARYNWNATTIRASESGAWVESNRTNYALFSDNLNGTGWAGIANTNLDQCAGRDGLVTMDELLSLGVLQARDRYLLNGGAYSTYAALRATVRKKASIADGDATISLNCNGDATVSSCTCMAIEGSGSCTPSIFNANLECKGVVTATQTPVDYALYMTCAGPSRINIRLAGGNYAVSTGNTCFGAVHTELLAAPQGISTFIPTGGSAAARTAESVAFTNPITSAPWCVSAKLTPYPDRAWGSIIGHVWNLGTGGAANSARVYFDASGNLIFNIYDNGGAVKTLTWVHGYATGSTHTITACADAAGAMSLWSDRVNTGAASSGAGTGIITAQPATLYVGADSSDLNQIDAHIQTKICKSTDATKDACTAGVW